VIETAPEHPYWMSCGVKGKMDEYYKFHRTSTEMGCERSCAMLNSTDHDNSRVEINKRAINYETDKALAFISKNDTFKTFDSLRKLTYKNFICKGNKTSPSDVQGFRMIIGGGTNLIDPSWNFCGIAIPPAAVVDFEVHDWTDCTAKIVHKPVCNSPEQHGLYMLMFDELGHGWSKAEYVIYSVPPTISAAFSSLWKLFPSTAQLPDDPNYIEVASGNLKPGKQTGFDPLCLSDGCYSIDVSLGTHPENVIWVFCSKIAPAGVRDAAFHVINLSYLLLAMFIIIYDAVVSYNVSFFLLLIPIICHRLDPKKSS
jgi:hypothetical protein